MSKVSGDTPGEIAVSHTPGPWTTQFIRGAREVDGPDGRAIAELWHRGNFPLEEANARLIAAAPDLLAACEEALTHLDNGLQPGWGVSRDILRAAIHKARGA